MKRTMGLMLRVFCVALVLCLTAGGLVSCAGSSEVPDGYQYATCKGEYFRLFVPTQWTVNTESGVSGAFYSSSDPVTVTMAEVAFDPPAEDTADLSETLAEGETAGEKKSDLELFMLAHLSEVAKLNGDPEIFKTFDTVLAGYRAVEIQYSLILDEIEYKIRQVLTKVSGRYFVFTYSAKAENFEFWLDTVDEILMYVTFESYPYDGEDQRKIPASVTAPEGMKLISDNEVAYRFYVPEDWVRDVNVGQNLVYASDSDRSNVSVISYAPENDAMTVAEYWELCLAEYEKSLENFTLVSESEDKVGERDAMVYEYTYTLGGVDYCVRQVLVKHSAMIYTMTYTALPENYATHLEDAVAMQNALTFRRNAFD